MRLAPVRDRRRHADGDDRRRRPLHTWNDLLGVVPGVFGVKTGHTDEAGWGQVAAAHGDGTTIYATILGSPSRARRNADLEALLAYGLAQYRQVDAVATGRAYASVALPYGRSPLPLVARSRLHAVVRVGAAADRARRRAGGDVAAGEPGPGARDGSRCGRADGCSARGRSSRRARSRSRGSRAASGGTRGVQSTTSSDLLTSMIVTVTLNAAFARTITVPNFQRGQRHRASAGAPARRREGDQRRAGTEGARRSRRRDRARRRPGRAAHRRAPDRRGDPERLRAHRGRVAHDDGRRRPDQPRATRRSTSGGRS